MKPCRMEKGAWLKIRNGVLPLASQGDVLPWRGGWPKKCPAGCLRCCLRVGRWPCTPAPQLVLSSAPDSNLSRARTKPIRLVLVELVGVLVVFKRVQENLATHKGGKTCAFWKTKLHLMDFKTSSINSISSPYNSEITFFWLFQYFHFQFKEDSSILSFFECFTLVLT